METSDYNVASSALQDVQAERERSRRTAERYRCPFVDLNEVRIDPELFRSIPAELMFRFNFVPLEARENQLGRRRGRSQPGLVERRIAAAARERSWS